ncbi:retrovirus-related pol polyprotein from transposon TNT 1-94, partial [Tanacetum coccineum]
MEKDQSINRPARSFCEKIHEAIFGRSVNRSSRSLGKDDSMSSSLSTNGYPTATGVHYGPLEIKPFKTNVPFTSNNVGKNRDGGHKSFSEGQCSSYIDSVKMKMRTPSDVGGGRPIVSSCDSFNDKVSGFINDTKLKATFGRFHRSSRYLKNNDASSPSLATTYYPAAHGHKQVIKPNKFVHFSSNIVDNNEEVDGLKTFNDEKYTSYIVGMKMKMRILGCWRMGQCYEFPSVYKDLSLALLRESYLTAQHYSESCPCFRTSALVISERKSDHGIIAYCTPLYTPQHNGVSERRNRTLLDMVRSMMSQTTLPKSFWDYALETVARILNMVPTKKVEKTPYEPDKLEPGSIKCIFIVYPKKTMVYSFYYPPENKILVARNAEFLENSLINQEANGSLKDLEIIQEEDMHPSIDTSLNHKEDDLEIDEPQSDIIPIRRSIRTRRPTDRMCLYIDAEEHELGDLGEPANYKDALLD